MAKPTNLGHTHLDRAVRDRGECPGCDRFWETQDARLAAKKPLVKVVRELDAMADRPIPGDHGTTWCSALKDTRHETHACIKPEGHPPPHHCPLCDEDWTR